jgi:hypothetical protein
MNAPSSTASRNGLQSKKNGFIATVWRVVCQLVDSDFRRDDQPDPETLPKKVNWERTVAFIFLHLG